MADDVARLDPRRAAALADQLADYEQTLDRMEIVGRPRRDVELARLHTLIDRNLDFAAVLLGRRST